MKYRKLFLILTIAALSLTACSKEATEVPTVEETVESVIEETEISENEEITEDTTTENNDTINESDIDAVMRGAREELDRMLAAGEITQEEYDEMIKDFMPEDTAVVDPDKQEFLDALKQRLENGDIAQEEYDAIVGEVVNGESIAGKGSVENFVDGIYDEYIDDGEASQYQDFENPGELREGVVADPSKDGNEQFNPDIEVPEHLKGKWM